jgi:endonuclease YncB( thermonuclease family)
MGIFLSKRNTLIVDGFDGESGDYNVNADYVPELGPEWIFGAKELEILKADFIDYQRAPDKVNMLSFDNRITLGKCCSVYDGDTINAIIKYNGEWIRHRFRMIGYNSPEIRAETEEEKKKAIEARDYLANRLLNKVMVMRLHKFDKYGRILCDVYIVDDSNITLDNIFKIHVNSEMISKGYGVPYMPSRDIDED